MRDHAAQQQNILLVELDKVDILEIHLEFLDVGEVLLDVRGQDIVDHEFPDFKVALLVDVLQDVVLVLVQGFERYRQVVLLQHTPVVVSQCQLALRIDFKLIGARRMLDIVAEAAQNQAEDLDIVEVLLDLGLAGYHVAAVHHGQRVKEIVEWVFPLLVEFLDPVDERAVLLDRNIEFIHQVFLLEESPGNPQPLRVGQFENMEVKAAQELQRLRFDAQLFGSYSVLDLLN